MIKLLMIEDMEELRKKTIKMLGMFGFDVDEAEDGEDGYNKITANDYDLIICDIKMPKMDGYMLLNKIRKIESKKNVPFIFLTSNIERAQVRKGMTIGADDYITKPFNIQELIDSIKIQLKKRKDVKGAVEKKFESKLSKLENVINYNELTKLPNEKMLNKFINQKKDVFKIIGLIYINIGGLEELGHFLKDASLINIYKVIIERINNTITQNYKIFHIRSNIFSILFLTNDNDLNEVSEKLNSISQVISSELKNPVKSDLYKLNFNAVIGINVEELGIDFNTDQFIKNTSITIDYIKKSGTQSIQTYSMDIKNKLSDVIRDVLKDYIIVDSEVRDTLKKKEPVIYEVKVFFLYPHKIIQEELIKEFVEHEYETYIIIDHKKLINLLELYNESILFINIDTVLSKNDWVEYVEEIKSNPVLSNVRIGILSLNDDDKLKSFFLMKLMIECGYVNLKLNLEDSRNIMLRVLEINEAKGRRKYIRVKCNDLQNVYFSIKINNKIIKGNILDLSIVGMACAFEDKEIYYRVGTNFNEIQLCLKGNICLVNGEITHVREMNDANIYVIMFDDSKHGNFKSKVHNFIYRILQYQIKKELELV